MKRLLTGIFLTSLTEISEARELKVDGKDSTGLSDDRTIKNVSFAGGADIEIPVELKDGELDQYKVIVRSENKEIAVPVLHGS